MKSTGMVRRVDDLGRIVIPKEIRRSLNIHDGEELEIKIDNNAIMLSKSSRIKNDEFFIRKVVTEVQKYLKNEIIITDCDRIVCSSVKGLNDKKNNCFLEQLIVNREALINKKIVLNIDDTEINGYFIILPIIANSDCYGLYITYNDNLYIDEQIIWHKLIVKIIESFYDIS